MEIPVVMGFDEAALRLRLLATLLEAQTDLLCVPMPDGSIDTLDPHRTAHLVRMLLPVEAPPQ